MNIGLIGLPQVGKKTLFQLLTGEPLKAEVHAGQDVLVFGKARIRDERFNKLVQIYEPAKNTPATLDIVLLPGFSKETLLSGECLKAVERCDALCHVVRAFENEAVFHIDGAVDPLRDLDKVFTELILSDLILVEKRLERIEKEVRIKADPRQVREKEILGRMKQQLDGNSPLINLELDSDERKLMSTYQFLTRRPLIVVLNVGDNQLQDTNLLEKVRKKYAAFGVRVMQISAKIEAEIAALSTEERQAFLEDLHIAEPALNLLSRLCFESLGLISFFTCGHNEVRQWTVRRGATAPEAAGVIHSDMQRGFIRAEIIKFNDFLAHGNEAEVKQAGKMFLKGKDYVLEDGDIMFVRFNV